MILGISLAACVSHSLYLGLCALTVRIYSTFDGPGSLQLKWWAYRVSSGSPCFINNLHETDSAPDSRKTNQPRPPPTHFPAWMSMGAWVGVVCLLHPFVCVCVCTRVCACVCFSFFFLYKQPLDEQDISSRGQLGQVEDVSCFFHLVHILL